MLRLFSGPDTVHLGLCLSASESLTAFPQSSRSASLHWAPQTSHLLSVTALVPPLALCAAPCRRCGRRPAPHIPASPAAAAGICRGDAEPSPADASLGFSGDATPAPGQRTLPPTVAATVGCRCRLSAGLSCRVTEPQPVAPCSTAPATERVWAGRRPRPWAGRAGRGGNAAAPASALTGIGAAGGPGGRPEYRPEKAACGRCCAVRGGHCAHARWWQEL